ncbi:MAG: band 7 protein [Leptospirales bacterium]|nr:band 7 protein [Leptospirales bacterium]
MLGIRYIKIKPTEYLMLYRGGRLRKHGAGLAFFYYAPASSLVIVPNESRDAPFIFNEVTIDFQEVTIQGQATYRVTSPEKLAGLLDFSVDAQGKRVGDGEEKLGIRITNAVQIAIREKFKGLSIRDALAGATGLVQHAMERLKTSELLTTLGISILDLSILKIAPTPDMARALEAAAREQLYKEADDAIYQRRNSAVEQERRIKENELQTQISIEEKNRKIREEQMNAEIAVQEKQRAVEEEKMRTQEVVAQKRNEIEEQTLIARTVFEEKKRKLVDLESANKVQYAKARAEAMRMETEVIAKLPPDVLEALLANQMDSRKLISRAIRDLAGNAQKIGSLNISPDLLESLLKDGE